MPETDQAVRSEWLASCGLQLPCSISYVIYIRHEDDWDTPTIPYPSCCVLAPGGLSYVSHTAGSHQDFLVLKTLTGDDLVSALLCLCVCVCVPCCTFQRAECLSYNLSW